MERDGLAGRWRGIPFRTRLATSVCHLRHDRMEQDPTEPHAGRGTFLLSSGGAGGGHVLLSITEPLIWGRIATKNQFPCQTPVACLLRNPPPPV